MKNYEWIYEDHGSCETYTAGGEMYELVVTINKDDEVVTGELWGEVPATYWEPADLVVKRSDVYESSGAARAALEAMDALDAEHEARMDQDLADAWERMREESSDLN
jgi:hypothetical protein